VVLVAQCAKETGWGRFGGAVTPSMNNPCGLKVRNPTGDTTADHALFPDMATGARAHADHLSLYAGRVPAGYDSPDDSPDPRAVYVWPGGPRFGSAPTVEQLGGLWAPSPTYGEEIVGIMTRLLGS
jgi:hypothetical protein